MMTDHLKLAGGYAGYHIYVDNTMVDKIETVVERKLWERIFSFSPFKKTRTIITLVPSEKILMYGNKLVMHEHIKKIIEKQGK